jgi:hypothetical protein
MLLICPYYRGWREITTPLPRLARGNGMID